MVYACLDTCCSHFLTIIAGVDLHFRHESELPVCRTRGLNPGRRAANHYTNDAGITTSHTDDLLCEVNNLIKLCHVLTYVTLTPYYAMHTPLQAVYASFYVVVNFKI